MKISKGWKTFLIGAAIALAGLVTGRAYAASSSATLNIDITVVNSAAVEIDSLGVSSTPGVAWTNATRLYASGDTVGMTQSSATVTNPGGLTERWYLSTVANSIDATGLGNPVWSLSASTNVADVGADQFALQAVFASSATTVTGAAAQTNCPQSGSASNNDAHDAIWNSTGTVVYTVAQVPIVTGDGGTAYGASGGALGSFSNFVDLEQNIGSTGGATRGASFCPDTGCSHNNYQMLTTGLGNGFGKRALCWRVILPQSTAASTNQIIPLIVTAQAQ